MRLENLCLACMRESLFQGVCRSCGRPAGFRQEPPYALAPGTILHGRYLTGAVLGFGGFGITYIGLDIAQEKKVALKEYMPNGIARRIPGRLTVSASEDKESYLYGISRFADEAKMIRRLDRHPGIVRVYGYFQENQTAYYAMEYLEGMDLKHYLSHHGGRLSFGKTIELLLPIMDALDYMHQSSILHRDISPDNIFVQKNGTVKLIDFGAARQALSNRSQSLSVILKKNFAPLEQYKKNGRQGPWTDIYALAATMYLILTGRKIPEAPERLIHDSLMPPEAYAPDIPPYVSEAIMKALSINGEDRPQTVRQFLGLLVRHGMRVTLHGTGGWYEGTTLQVEGILTLGRNKRACQLVFPAGARGISGLHCQIIYDEGQRTVILKDLNSTYGTRVNGKCLPRGGECRLHDGDRFSLGEENFQVEIQEDI